MKIFIGRKAGFLLLGITFLILTWYTWVNLMPEPITWDSLTKKVDDLTTIVEQIAADILTHNQDPSAHGQVDEAVYDHRINSDLDHPDGSISLKKLVKDNILMMTCFESLDGWLTHGTISVGVLGTRIETPAVADEVAYVLLEAYPDMDPSKNPFFQTTIAFDQITNQLAYIVMGTEPVEANDSFGFKIDDNNLYAYWTNGGNQNTQAIAGITLTDSNVFRAFCDSTEEKIYFYVNGLLRYTATADFLEDSNPFLFDYWIQTKVNTVKGMRMFDLMLQIDR